MNFTKTSFAPFSLLTVLLVATFATIHAVRLDPTQPLTEPLPETQTLGKPFGFGTPDFSNSLGSGSGSVASAGYGMGLGPNGGYFKSQNVAPSSTVCNVQGPCYQMTLTCPPKCYKSFSNLGTNYGFGGGGGGCSFDCTTTCTANC